MVKLGQILEEEGMRALGCAHGWSEPSVCRNRGVKSIICILFKRYNYISSPNPLHLLPFHPIYHCVSHSISL